MQIEKNFFVREKKHLLLKIFSEVKYFAEKFLNAVKKTRRLATVFSWEVSS